MDLIIIAGMPASGKSTIAKKIGVAFGYPILEKDEIKEELFDVFGYENREEKRRLDVAANAVLVRCAESILKSGTSLILVNNFPKEKSAEVQEMIRRCGCRCVTLFLDGDHEVFYHRYVERDLHHARHMGHRFILHYPLKEGDDPDRSMTREDFREIFEKQGMAEFRIEGPRIPVDATYPETVNVDELIRQIRTKLEEC